MDRTHTDFYVTTARNCVGGVLPSYCSSPRVGPRLQSYTPKHCKQKRNKRKVQHDYCHDAHILLTNPSDLKLGYRLISELKVRSESKVKPE